MESTVKIGYEMPALLFIAFAYTRTRLVYVPSCILLISKHFTVVIFVLISVGSDVCLRLLFGFDLCLLFNVHGIILNLSIFNLLMMEWQQYENIDG